MTGKLLARIVAVFFIAFALTAMVIDMARAPDPGPGVAFISPADPAAADDDPWRRRLARCQALGEAGDPDCLAAWAESRRRFLGGPEGR